MNDLNQRPGTVTASATPAGDFVDLRGFKWPLAPLQTRLEWELGSAKTRLAKALGALAQAKAALGALLDSANAQARNAGAVVGESIDPVARREALSFLVELGFRVDAARQRFAAADGAAAAARADCIQRQQRLDTLLAARDKALKAHVRTRLQRHASEADAQWLARWNTGARREPGRNAVVTGEGAAMVESAPASPDPRARLAVTAGVRL